LEKLEVPLDLIIALRVFLMSSNEFESFQKDFNHQKINDQNEDQVYQTIIQLAESKLFSFRFLSSPVLLEN
jgi:hypothetical protein